MSVGRSVWIRTSGGRNCFRQATVRLGIDTSIANILVRTVLCCVVYDTCTQWHAHTWAVLTDECWFKFRFSFCEFVCVQQL